MSSSDEETHPLLLLIVEEDAAGVKEYYKTHPETSLGYVPHVGYPLGEAIRRSSLEVVDVLIELGCAPKAGFCACINSLKELSGEESVQRLQHLISKCTEPVDYETYFYTGNGCYRALGTAVWFQNLPVVEFLLQQGVNVQGKKAFTMGGDPVEETDWQMSAFGSAIGAKCQECRGGRKACWREDCFGTHLEIIRLLLRFGTDLSMPFCHGGEWLNGREFLEKQSKRDDLSKERELVDIRDACVEKCRQSCLFILLCAAELPFPKDVTKVLAREVWKTRFNDLIWQQED
jgi:hypothetical protein